MTELQIDKGTGAEWCIGKIQMEDQMWLNMQGLNGIKELLVNTNSDEWLNESINSIKSEMDNCEKKAIRGAQEEIVKAKALLKEKFPKRYKWSYYKILLLNPFKTITAKWLLR